MCNCVYMYFGLHDLYVCAFPLWFARFAQPTQWQDSTIERTCIDVFCTSYFPLRQQLSRQKRNGTCRYVFPILWVMPRLAQENSTRNINVRRCWWSNRSELALHHIFEWVNGGKSSLMSLGPAEIISADIFLQSATPWGGKKGALVHNLHHVGSKTNWPQPSVYLMPSPITDLRRPLFPCLWKLPKTARAPLA